METAKKVYKRKKRGIKWGRIVIIAFSIAYIIMFVYTFFAQSVETVNIVYGDVEVVETVYGYITRNEQIVTAKLNGVLYPTITEGERVSKGQSVAIIKNGNDEEISKRIKEITKKMGKLTTPAIFNNDIMLIDNEVNSMLNSVMLSNYNETFYSLKDVRSKIDSKLHKKSEIIGQNSAKGTIEREYFDELKKYESQLTFAQEELTAPIAGTVAYKLDGYENVFVSTAISDYDAETLEGLDVPAGELVGTMKQNSFKIVDNIEGYVTIISDSKNALDAVVDEKIKLRFPEISQEIITGKVEFVTREKDDRVVLTLRINRGIENLINYRKIKVDIIWDDATGMKVPSTAIKHEEKQDKIFVVNGNRAIEKEVKVTADWNNEAIIEGTENNKIFLYDAIAKDANKVSKDKIIISN